MRGLKLISMAGMIVCSFFLLNTTVFAQSDENSPQVVINFFWREGCSHCADETPVLQGLVEKYPQVELKAYEVSQTSANLDYFFALGNALGFATDGVPVTIIGDQVWTGYIDSYAAEMETALTTCMTSGCPDPSDALSIDKSKTIQSLEGSETEKSSFPIWIIFAVAVVFLSYGFGVFLRKRQKQHVSKKHHH